MPIVGVNYCLPILHLFKIMVHIYTTEKTIHKFAIDYIVNPSLNLNNAFRTQVENSWVIIFKKFLMKNNTSVIALIMIYENN